MKRPNQSADIMKRLAEALGVDPDAPNPRKCDTDGHSLDHALNDNIYCSICGKAKAEIDAAVASGEYQYDAIKYLEG
jgi:hypothetical protein